MIHDINNTLVRMENIVQANVDYYKSDFYNYDVNTVKNMKPGECRIWSIRDTGTYLLNNPWAQEATMSMNIYKAFYKLRRISSKEYSVEELTPEAVRTWIKEKE